MNMDFTILLEAVIMLKQILQKSSDPYLGELTYRATVLQHGLSPAQLFTSRHLEITEKHIMHDFAM